MHNISAYLPCYNNESTILLAIESVRQQTVPVAEIFVIDDGSSDNSATIVENAGVRLIQNSSNQGRGAVRAKAILESKHELVLCCDAGIALCPDFAERALTWTCDEKVAAVHGRVVQGVATTLSHRWRGRHLFKINATPIMNQHAVHATYGALVKKSMVLSVGNYRQDLSAGEDKDLGTRLLTAGYDVIFDPAIAVRSLTSDTAWQALERYWRWHSSIDDDLNWQGYLRQIAYATKVMAAEDLKAGDPDSVLISLISPHYQFWRSWWWRFRQSRK